MQRVDLAYAQLGSSEVARDINRDLVLQLIRTRQPVSRADLSRYSGLQPSTISSIVEQLLRERWISEGPVAQRPRGRRPTLLSLNQAIVMLAVDVQPRQATLAVVDVNGHALSRETVALVRDPHRGVEALGTAMLRLMQQHPDRVFEGAGLSMPGRVDPATQRLVFAPNLPWCGADVRSLLQQRLKLKVEMENAANACLLSELWFGRMDGVRHAVLITIAEGVGAAILVGGQLVSGAHGMAGEFGHIAIDRNGPPCGCGRRGCWEVFASSRAALQEYARLSGRPVPTAIAELLELVRNGDSHARAALVRQARYLGMGLHNITATLAPEVILLTGGLTAMWDTLVPYIAEELAKHTLAGEPPVLRPTSDLEMARLKGAAALVLQRHTGAQGEAAARTR
ncbi:MAG: ROK family transcriptional regulator [Acidobacteriota bacterium]|nr:ROK family transcriptional regulator [Acidobacteriota bacterium]